MSVYYYLNGIQMPAATEFELSPTSLYSENTGRNEIGVNHLDLIRPWVRKYSVTHEMLTSAEVDQIVAQLNPRGYSCTFEGSTFTAVTGSYAKSKQGITSQGIRWKLSFTVTEN